MTRQVYLMERDPSFFRWFIGFFLKVRQIKVGVAKNSNQRNKQVDSGIKGRIVLIESYRIKAATRTEHEILTKYKGDKFKPPVHKKGSGETEFLKITTFQVLEIKSVLSRRSTSDFKKIFFLLLFLILLFFYFLKLQ